MVDENILKVVEANYKLKILSIEKIKNVYKIICDDGVYCLKVIKYSYPHFYFIISAINHLKNRGFNNIPDIIRTINNEQYVCIQDKYAYLTKWILGRESNYDNPLELKSVTIKLAELHKASEGFNINKDMKPRIGWYSWINVFKTRKNEILDFKNRIYQKAHKNEFDIIYLECIEEEINRADRSIRGLVESNYIKYMDKEVFKRGFCHHDYANHNILIDNDENLSVIDFDYCILDTCIHDLSSLIIRSMKNRRWDIRKGQDIIKNYSEYNKVDEEALNIIKEFIRFPQGFWQIGIQKYWEQQSWEEEFFLSKISKYVEDRNDREEFVNKFFS